MGPMVIEFERVSLNVSESAPWHREVHRPFGSLPSPSAPVVFLFWHDSFGRCAPFQIPFRVLAGLPALHFHIPVTSITFPHIMSTDLQPLYTMRKQEMAEELERYGVETSAQTTKDVMLITLRALRADVKQAPSGFHHKTKKELVALCIAKGLEVDEKNTCAELRLMFQGVDLEGTISEARRDAAGDASPATARRFRPICSFDKMGFGKHHDKTYKDVLLADFGYSQWAVLEMHLGRAPPRLYRFARWAEAHGCPELPKDKLTMTLEEAATAECIVDDSVRAAVDLAKASGAMKQAVDLAASYHFEMI